MRIMKVLSTVADRSFQNSVGRMTDLKFIKRRNLFVVLEAVKELLHGNTFDGVNEFRSDFT